MPLACRCLNLTIETKDDLFDSSDLELNEAEARDAFFQEPLRFLSYMPKISMAHPALVDSWPIGVWTVYQCINCTQKTHAVRKDNKDSRTTTAICSKLLTTFQINELKSSNLYSNVYNIAVNSNMDNVPYRSYDYLPAEVELMLAGVKKVANERIKLEYTAAEERIRRYTEREYAALDEFKEKTVRDQRALTRIILNNKLSKLNHPVSTKSSPLLVSAVRKVPESEEIKGIAPPAPIPQRTKITTGSPYVQTPEKKKQPTTLTRRRSIDAEEMFILDDGVETREIYSNSEGEQSETEEREEKPGRYKKPDNMGGIAKSLPMNIPVFLSAFAGHENEDSEDAGDDPTDIAASMKALAQSLRGDHVFGELPRPRCRTNI